jgi:TonB family protein
MTGELRTKTRTPNPSLERLVGIGVTVVMHLGLIAAVVFGRKPKVLPAKPKRAPVMTRLVEVPIKAGSQKGTEEDPSKVRKGPRVRPQPTPSEPQERNPSYRARKKPVERKQDDEKKVEEKIKKQAMLDQLAEQELDPTTAKGGGLGTAKNGRTDVDAKGAGGKHNKGLTDPCALTFKQDVRSYRSKIQSKVSGFKRPSFVSAEVAENLVVTVRVTFDTSGKIVSVSTASSSGNPRFDAAAESYIKGLGALSPPPRCVMFNLKTGKFLQKRSFLVRLKGK